MEDWDGLREWRRRSLGEPQEQLRVPVELAVLWQCALGVMAVRAWCYGSVCSGAGRALPSAARATAPPSRVRQGFVKGESVDVLADTCCGPN